MSEPSVETRTLQEREDDASNAMNDLRADAEGMKDHLEAIGDDVTVIEENVSMLDDRAFDLTVQQSGAMDLMNGPLVEDTDNAHEITEIVEAEVSDVRADLLEVHDAMTDVKRDLADLGADLDAGHQRADVLAAEVEAIRAEGGDIHPDAVVAEADDGMGAWMDSQLHGAPTDETHPE